MKLKMDKKKERRFLGIGVVVAIALLAFVGLQALAVSDSGDEVGIEGIERELEGDVGEIAVAASAVTNSINYQGRLTDSAGEPLSGTYSMTFRLYEVASGGTALSTDTHIVIVTDGLFNTNIDFDQSYFDGRELWLGIAVGADAEMTPRQELRAVPYALSLRPGAVINGSVLGSILNVVNHGYGGDGVYARTYGANSFGVYITTTGEYGTGVYAHTSGNGSVGVHACTSGDDSDGVYAHTYGDSSDGVHAYSANGYGVYGEGKYGGYFTTNQAGTSYDPNAGVNVTTAQRYSDGVYARTDGDDSYGVYARTYGNRSNGVYARTYGNDSFGVYAYTTGDDSEGVYAYTTGDDSEGVHACTSGDGSDGVYARTYGNDSDGVHAYSANGYGVYGKGKYGGYFTTNQGGTIKGYSTAGVNVSTAYDYSHGVYARTYGDNSHGVLARTDGDNSDGVYAYTTGDGSDGVRAYSANGYGVYGNGKYGGYFTTNQAGTLHDHNAGVNVTTAYDYSDGVYARTDGDRSNGVRARTTGDDSFGVFARTDGDDSEGVFAQTYGDDSEGVYARTYGNRSDGVYAHTTGDDSDGVNAYSASGHGVFARGAGPGEDGTALYAVASHADGIALWGKSNSTDSTLVLRNDGTGDLIRAFSHGDWDYRFRVENDGRTTVNVLKITGGSDLSEQFDIHAAEGDAMPGALVSIDPEHPGQLTLSRESYDYRVAGIISGAGGIQTGMLMGQEGSQADGSYPVALSGRVYCWADASNSPIEPGDLLTTSDIPGHAMKVTDYTRAQGAVIGKAMSSLDEGQGLVLVLVTLQ